MVIVRNIFITALPILLVGMLSGVASAQIQQQEILANEYERAQANYDFAEQLRILEAMLPLAQPMDGRRPFVMADDLHLRIEDLRSAVQFQGAKREKALHIEQMYGKAIRHFRRKEHTEAISTYREAIQLSKEIYGATSLHSLTLSKGLATMFINTGSDFDEAETLLTGVLDVLRNKDKTDSEIQLRAMMGLTDLYMNREEVERAADLGEECSRIFENWKAQHSVPYQRLHINMAEFMNRQARHEAARDHARKSLNTGFVATGSNVHYYIRAQREHAYAKVKLGDYEKVPEAYEEIMKILDQTPEHPEELHLQYLREYRDVLETLGRNERLREIDEEISRMEEKGLVID